MRALLDRDRPLYKVVYTQRTCCERINSQAKDLGYSPAQSAQYPLDTSAQYPDLHHHQHQGAPTRAINASLLTPKLGLVA